MAGIAGLDARRHTNALDRQGVPQRAAVWSFEARAPWGHRAGTLGGARLSGTWEQFLRRRASQTLIPCVFFALERFRRFYCNRVLLESWGQPMKTLSVLVVVSVAFLAAGCTHFGKVPIGKTPAPVVTKY